MATIEAGTRVRVREGIVGPAAATGRLGTVLLATLARDAYLVEADQPFPVATALGTGRTATATRRRAWCAADELEAVVGEPGWEPARTATRAGRPPSDVASVHRQDRHGVGPRVLETLSGRAVGREAD